MPLQATSGAASYDAFGGGVAAVPQYIEDVFSTYLYTGNGSTQTITNGIDLAGEGGLVWVKKRDSTTVNAGHYLVDTARGAGNYITSNSTNASSSDSQISAFNNNGFNIGSDGANVNLNGSTYVSWTFRKQPKFFDVVTYTGNGVAGGRQIAHSLGSTPAFIVIKCTNDTGNWMSLHKDSNLLFLNTTASQYPESTTAAYFGNGTSVIRPNDTNFTIGNAVQINTDGNTYVAYLFAHNAGGFGLTGTDNVISCGSMVTSTPLVNVNLGYEPQWVMWKRTDATGNWGIADNMRGMPVSGDDQVLIPNLSNAESLATRVAPNATGFTFDGGVADGSTFIYIAIRRGPMKVPTSGTSVYKTVLSNPTNSGTSVTGAGFPPDLNLALFRGGSAVSQAVFDRLRGGSQYLVTSSTAAEGTVASDSFLQDGFFWGSASGESLANTFMRRAPSFFDEVCFTTQSSSDMRISHNLSVAPELILMKGRDSAVEWTVYYPTGALNKYLVLNSTATPTTTSGYNFWGATAPSSTTFGLNVNETYGAGATMVAYLFATCAGVSKVGSYTGTGTTLQVDCGFTGGARFVLIKRTSGTGDWYVWDSARGIVSGNDPYLLLNSTAAEVTSTDYIDTYSAGFEISSTAPAAINASGGTFIFLAIA